MTKPPKPTKLDARIRAARQAKLRAWNSQWNQDQIKKGVDGPVPEGRKKGSDYNQHVPIMEASRSAQDLFFARAKAIMAMDAKALGLEPQDDDNEEMDDEE